MPRSSAIRAASGVVRTGVRPFGSAAVGRAACSATNASTSRSITRPCGPVPRPESRATTTPFSSAIRRARGDRKTGVAIPFAAGRGRGAEGCCPAEAGACAVTGGVLTAACDPSAPASASSASMESSAPPRIAIGCRIATMASARARILRTTPSDGASTSIDALSVSISSSTSPARTASPSFLCHLRIVPSSIVEPSCGILKSCAMSKTPLS